MTGQIANEEWLTPDQMLTIGSMYVMEQEPLHIIETPSGLYVRSTSLKSSEETPWVMTFPDGGVWLRGESKKAQ